jgi:hypothetical protein
MIASGEGVLRFNSQPVNPRAIWAATRPAKSCGDKANELVQWMVQDASQKSWGLKLT